MSPEELHVHVHLHGGLKDDHCCCHDEDCECESRRLNYCDHFNIAIGPFEDVEQDIPAWRFDKELVALEVPSDRPKAPGSYFVGAAWEGRFEAGFSESQQLRESIFKEVSAMDITMLTGQKTTARVSKFFFGGVEIPAPAAYNVQWKASSDLVQMDVSSTGEVTLTSKTAEGSVVIEASVDFFNPNTRETNFLTAQFTVNVIKRPTPPPPPVVVPDSFSLEVDTPVDVDVTPVTIQSTKVQVRR